MSKRAFCTHGLIAQKRIVRSGQNFQFEEFLIKNEGVFGQITFSLLKVVAKETRVFSRSVSLFELTLFKLHIKFYQHRPTGFRDMSRVMRKPTFWSETNQTVQLLKMARGLKFRI